MIHRLFKTFFTQFKTFAWRLHPKFPSSPAAAGESVRPRPPGPDLRLGRQHPTTAQPGLKLAVTRRGGSSRPGPAGPLPRVCPAFMFPAGFGVNSESLHNYLACIIETTNRGGKLQRVTTIKNGTRCKFAGVFFEMSLVRADIAAAFASLVCPKCKSCSFRTFTE